MDDYEDKEDSDVHVQCDHDKSLSPSSPSSWTVAQLKDELVKRQLPCVGSKDTLLCILQLSDNYANVQLPLAKKRTRSRSPEPASDFGFPEDCIKCLECPVCMEVFEGHIYQCTQGHSLCSTCLNKLPNRLCPTCRTNKIGQTRNLALEHLLEKVTNEANTFFNLPVCTPTYTS